MKITNLQIYCTQYHIIRCNRISSYNNFINTIFYRIIRNLNNSLVSTYTRRNGFTMRITRNCLTICMNTLHEIMSRRFVTGVLGVIRRYHRYFFRHTSAYFSTIFGHLRIHARFICHNYRHIRVYHSVVMFTHRVLCSLLYTFHIPMRHQCCKHMQPCTMRKWQRRIYFTSWWLFVLAIRGKLGRTFAYSGDVASVSA